MFLSRTFPFLTVNKLAVNIVHNSLRDESLCHAQRSMMNFSLACHSCRLVRIQTHSQLQNVISPPPNCQISTNDVFQNIRARVCVCVDKTQDRCGPALQTHTFQHVWWNSVKTLPSVCHGFCLALLISRVKPKLLSEAAQVLLQSVALDQIVRLIVGNGEQTKRQLWETGESF